jgi:cytochrome c oxidase subunit IV
MATTTGHEAHGHSHGHGHAHAALADAGGHQQHPLKVYFVVWIGLFVLSFFSYMVDYFDIQGMLRWTLILLFMVLKAGFIMAIFMHMVWERPALVYAIVVPVGALVAFMLIMTFEASYVHLTRILHFVPYSGPDGIPIH